MSGREQPEGKKPVGETIAEGKRRIRGGCLSGAPACRAADAPKAEPGAVPRRRKRRTNARARTISIRRLSKTELNRGREEFPETAYWKPRTRGECRDMERPCPYVSCKYHLFIDVHPVRGSIKINFPDLEVWEMTESCALDIADRGGITLEDVGVIMNLTRERVRQLETQGLGKLKVCEGVEKLAEYLG
jgi:hypothetical protein